MTSINARWLWVPQESWEHATKSSDTILTVLIIDPIVRIIFPTVLKIGITPNAVTCLRLCVAVFGAAVFGTGHLVAGSFLFLAWYFLDCIDGKLARLTGQCSAFGDWLDRMTDRLGVGAILWGLAVHFLKSGDQAAALSAVALTTIWFLRVMNGDRLSWMASAQGQNTEHASSRRCSTPYGLLARYKNWAARLRLTPYLVHDVEWLTLALFVGPLSPSPLTAIILAIIGMTLQTIVQILSFWRNRIRPACTTAPDHTEVVAAGHVCTK